MWDLIEPEDEREERRIEWTTRDGRTIKIKEMCNAHLLNAYNLTHDKWLFEEMVLRLFKRFTNS